MKSKGVLMQMAFIRLTKRPKQSIQKVAEIRPPSIIVPILLEGTLYKPERILGDLDFH